MAHVGQKIRLGFGGGFGRCFGDRQVCGLYLRLLKQLLGLQRAYEDLGIERYSR